MIRIIRRGNAVRERTYLVLIDIFILMCAMGVALGILFLTINPNFGLIGQGIIIYERPQWHALNPNVVKAHPLIRKFLSTQTIQSLQSFLGKDGWYGYGQNYLIKKGDSLFVVHANSVDSSYQVYEQLWQTSGPAFISFNPAHFLD